MSRIRLLATGSACSEMTEKGCEVERVGAVPQAGSVDRRIAMIAVLSIHQSPESSRRTIVLPRPARVNSWERSPGSAGILPASSCTNARQAGCLRSQAVKPFDLSRHSLGVTVVKMFREEFHHNEQKTNSIFDCGGACRICAGCYRFRSGLSEKLPGWG